MLAAILICGGAESVDASEMRFLGSASGYSARLTDLSYDGLAACGYNLSTAGRYLGFTWTAQTGRADFAPAGVSTMFEAVSSSAQFVAGNGPIPGVTPGNLYRVVSGTAVEELGRPRQVQGSAVALDMTPSGSAIVGYFQALTTRTAFRWTAATGVVVLGAPQDGRTATGVSADGSAICGWSGYNLSFTHAFVWREGLGTTQLLWHPDTPNPATASARARAMSGDGRTIVGWSDGPHNIDAISWVEGVPTRLTAPNGWFASDAYGVSGDGSVIIGGMNRLSDPFDNGVEFIKTPELGMMEARAYFARHGAVLPDTARITLSCVSGDGRSFGGTYFDPVASPFEQGFVFTVPGPSSIALAGVVACAALRRRGRQQRPDSGARPGA